MQRRAAKTLLSGEGLGEVLLGRLTWGEGWVWRAVQAGRLVLAFLIPGPFPSFPVELRVIGGLIQPTIPWNSVRRVWMNCPRSLDKLSST